MYDKIKKHRRLFLRTKKREFSEGKKNIIAELLEEYDIQSAEDIEEALKDLLGGTIQNMMEAELSEHLGYERNERNNSENAGNGTKPKTLRSQYGEIPISVPQDHNSEFEPKVVPNIIVKAVKLKPGLTVRLKLWVCHGFCVKSKRG